MNKEMFHQFSSFTPRIHSKSAKGMSRNSSQGAIRNNTNQNKNSLITSHTNSNQNCAAFSTLNSDNMMKPVSVNNEYYHQSGIY